MVENILLTFIVGLFCALLFKKMKVPGGMLVGSIIGVIGLNFVTGLAVMPYWAKLIAQITAGAYIGNTLKKNDLPRLITLIVPTVVVICSFLIINITIGVVIHLISPLDLPTALMCAVPGGVSDIPLIAVDMGANATTVIVFQFVRLVCGICILPQMIAPLQECMPFQ